jgi:DNA mismatch repair protein MLH3
VDYVELTVCHTQPIVSDASNHYSDTSKAGRQSVSSYKGLFLSALATMSLLTISSRHHGQPQTNTVIFHESKVISRLVPAPTHQEIHGSHGTRVTVNNLFGNMPVRVKHRASTLQRPEDVDKEWEGLKRMIVALALSNARLQKLRLSDKDRTHTLHIRLPHTPADILQSETTDSDILRLQTIFAQSGLISSTGANEWVRMSANTLEVAVKAYVALSSSPTKLNQFISLGINPVYNAHSNTNVLYNEINQVFTASDFGLSETSSENIMPEGRGPKLKGVVRGAKRWPMFYLRIDVKKPWEIFPNDETAIESDRTLQHITEILHAMFYQFLQQHHYRPRKRRRVLKEASSTPHPRDAAATSSSQRTRDISSISSIRGVPATAPTEAFDSGVKIPAPSRKQWSHYFNNFTSWSRVKSGDNKAVKDLLSCRPREHGHPGTVAFPSEVDRPVNVSSWFENQPLVEANSARHSEQETADGLIPWVDPSTNSVVLVNSRTGQCSAGHTRNDRPNTSIGVIRPRSAGPLMRESIKRPQSAPARSESAWYENLVNHWSNPVFSRLEQPIMSIETDSVFGDYSTRNNLQGCQHRSWDLARGTEAVDKSSGKLSRKGLAEARVIAQVDRKFILVRMPMAEEHRFEDGKSDKMLVLFDQHAADERCRLENLLSDMFTIDEEGDSASTSIRVHTLPTPIQYPIQENEMTPFKVYSKYFSSWGCHYKIEQVLIDTTKKRPTIRIEALPHVIAERCRLEPKLFVDLLRKEIWSRAGERVPLPRSSTTTTTPNTGSAIQFPFPWLHWLAGCPEGITDLISSRACRSSIMFNDPLSMEECKSLISRLSHCAFPFQCAHGRPTMIPIVVVDRHHHHYHPCLPVLPVEHEGDSDSYYFRGREVQKETGFFEAFKKWTSA